MEQLNRIELIGIVGRSTVQDIEGNTMAKFSMVTNYAYLNRERTAVIETTWHNITAFECQKIKAQDLRNLSKGTPVKIFGRLKTMNYTTPEGEEKTVVEVAATSLEILDTNLTPEL